MQRREVLRLYRSLLKEATRVLDYSLKAYVRRRSGEYFRQNSGLTDPQKAKEAFNWGSEELKVIQRQRIVQNLYFGTSNVLQQK